MRLALLLAALVACKGGTDSGPAVGPDTGDTGTPSGPALDWRPLIEEDPAGAWLSAWGLSDQDVWVVGGQPEVGAIRRGPLDDLQLFDVPAGTPLLNWVHGVAEDDVWVGGIAGTLLHWDGAAWTDHSVDVEEAIWGVYAIASDEVYAVGGQSGFGGESALALRWDGVAWSSLALPEAAEGLTNLFKVHWDGTALWMVGHKGAALRGDGVTFDVAPTGTTADLVTANRPVDGGPLVVVGGRGTGVVAEVEGDGLAVKVQAQAGLNGVQVLPSGDAVVVGEAGYSALYDIETDTLTSVLPVTRDVLHATWGLPGSELIAVGGNLFTSEDTFLGTILIAPSPE